MNKFIVVNDDCELSDIEGGFDPISVALGALVVAGAVTTIVAVADIVNDFIRGFKAGQAEARQGR